MSKRKGNAFERLIAKDINDAGLDKYARRSVMSGALFEPGDLKTSLPFYIECKHRKRVDVYAFYNQIKRDIANKAFGTSKAPLVIMRKDKEDILAAMEWYDFLSLMAYAMHAGYPDKDLDG